MRDHGEGLGSRVIDSGCFERRKDGMYLASSPLYTRPTPRLCTRHVQRRTRHSCSLTSDFHRCCTLPLFFLRDASFGWCRIDVVGGSSGIAARQPAFWARSELAGRLAAVDAGCAEGDVRVQYSQI